MNSQKPVPKPFTTLHTAPEADATLHQTLHSPFTTLQPFTLLTDAGARASLREESLGIFLGIN
ncbi:MAG: hypothetical protein J2P36_18955, partial [Ktedonobacteraceae bacterium]|nr:hypothetical protein [Ktedonobacteraceae bacterium]